MENKTLVFEDHSLKDLLSDGLISDLPREKFEEFQSENCKKIFVRKDANEFDTMKSTPCLRGIAVFKDTDGKVLLVKKNLVVLRGRTFSLEKIFDLDLDGSFAAITPEYVGNRSRHICLFKIGSGGTLPSDPFNPIVVQPGERDLAEAKSFRTLVPDLGDVFTAEEAERYYGEIITSGGPDGDVYDYYLKRINLSNNFTPEWNFDIATNTTAVKVTLKIDNGDASGQLINELGLYIAQVGAGPTFTDVEMISRLTFDTEPMSTNKEVTIEYYIFA